MKKIFAILFGLIAMIMPVIAQENPRVRVEMKKCWREGNYVWMSIVLNNYSGQDKTVLIYNEYHGDKTTAVYDDYHREYDYAMIVNNEYQDLSINNFQHIECPNGVPVKFFIIASNVPASTKSIGRLNVSVDRYITPFVNIPIEQGKPNTNMENITCSMPDIKLDFKSCERNSEDIIINFVMSTDLENGLYFTWNIGKIGIYDDSGNKYAWSLNMVGMQENGQMRLPSKTPVAGKMIVKKVPVSTTELHTVLLPLSVNYCGHLFTFEVRMNSLKTGMKPENTQGLSSLFRKQSETETVSIARKFLTAMVNGDVKTMLSYDIDYVKANAEKKAKLESEYTDYVTKTKGATFTLGEQKADPEGFYAAFVDAVVTMTDGSTQSVSIPFVKENGKLYIQLSS